MAKSLRNIMGCGIGAGAAAAINGVATDSLTATGSTQGTALALSSDIAIFSTVAASTGAILPGNGSPSDSVLVHNLGANALTVYPATGQTINGGAANASFSIPASKAALFTLRPAATGWIALLGA